MCVAARTRRQGSASASETGIVHQTESRLPVSNHVFLESWTVDICQESCSLRSAPQRRHMIPLRRCSHGAPRKLSGLDPVGNKDAWPTWDSVLAKHLVAWAAGTWEGHKTHVHPSLWLWGVPENPNLSSLDLGITGPVPLRSNLEPEQCRHGKHTPPWAWENPVCSIHCKRFPKIHTHIICLQCSSLPTTQLNKWAEISDHLCPLVPGQKLDTEETCKERKPK